jgi:hypothetical protein
MSQIKFRAIIRDAIIYNKTREYQLRQIIEVLGCSRTTAKQLFFAFLYNATDEFLSKKFDEWGGKKIS